MNVQRSLMRRIVVLCALLVCLLALTTGFSVNTSRPHKAYLPCCSTCEQNPSAPLCRFGCSPDCAKRH
jgi:hypothetical protein